MRNPKYAKINKDENNARIKNTKASNSSFANSVIDKTDIIADKIIPTIKYALCILIQGQSKSNL